MIKVLIWGVDDLFPQIAPYYFQKVKEGLMEIVGYAVDIPGGGGAVTAQRPERHSARG